MRMFSDLPKKIQTSFKTTTTNALINWLDDHYYELSDISIERLTNELVEGYIPRYSYRYKWGDVGEFEVEPKLMEELVLGSINRHRKKKISTKQMEFYRRLCRSLGVDEVSFSDYIDFSQQLCALKNRYDKEIRPYEPATDNQLRTVKRLWKDKYGEELEDKEYNRKEISQLFKRINEG
ncbi:hypothetical protein [Desertibacillus haloalkaliphilus]|uniref:hypothetical protein n=1 Tax=Desertibacillus haloalkaliphilus TaxID=1328930 RepID=UPI001C267F14|nr:hypothetical protein [Desertibacillus haloalkaliphilus]MBU8908103.1 hypothetical protein [Desertibacillus haloalkaliphilus]